MLPDDGGIQDSVPSFPAMPRSALILTFPGVLLLDVAGPAQVFETASRVLADRGGGPGYRVVTASLRGGPVVSDTGIALSSVSHRDAGPADTLLVPGGSAIKRAEADGALLDAIRSAAAGARRTASVCLGAFLLAAAGLLDGRRAATHWRYCDQLRARYPAIRVEADPIFVRDGPIWSSAGVSAGIDLTLALVEEDHGHAVALEVARRLVVFLKRPGGQAQFSRTLRAQQSDGSGDFAPLHAWMADHLSADLRVERLAERSAMSPRSFARLYAARTGRTPARAVEAMRLEAACRLLTEQPSTPVARIAERCGFGDDERMRRAFLRGLGVSPSDYRARFGTAAPPRPAPSSTCSPKPVTPAAPSPGRSSRPGMV